MIKQEFKCEKKIGIHLDLKYTGAEEVSWEYDVENDSGMIFRCVSSYF